MFYISVGYSGSADDDGGDCYDDDGDDEDC